MLTPHLPRLHLLLYSTLLGTELFQTFILTKVSFHALPRSAFITLQKRLFPVYFRAQTLLLVLTAATLPLSRLLVPVDAVLFTVAGATAVRNLVVYEPRTRGAVGGGTAQERRDSAAREGGDSAVREEVKRLKREFSWNHAMTIHLNLVSVGAMLVYGWRLGGRLAL
ncbi:hypothetical protein QBC39DRAFT_267016 [Podospora conica]|nr:hypothetical protein QBC39DRAFT_267016 [Schizothecium conicum]